MKEECANCKKPAVLEGKSPDLGMDWRPLCDEHCKAFISLAPMEGRPLGAGRKKP